MWPANFIYLFQVSIYSVVIVEELTGRLKEGEAHRGESAAAKLGAWENR